MENEARCRKLLERLRASNEVDRRDYDRAAAAMPALRLKQFFEEQEKQKREFDRIISEKIVKLNPEGDLEEDSFESLSKKAGDDFEEQKDHETAEEGGLSLWCEHREQRNFLLYQKLLAEIEDAEIREMLMHQKHKIALALEELKELKAEGQNS